MQCTSRECYNFVACLFVWNNERKKFLFDLVHFTHIHIQTLIRGKSAAQFFNFLKDVSMNQVPFTKKKSFFLQSSLDRKTLVNTLTEARTQYKYFTLINCLQNMYNFNKHTKLLSFKFAYMDVCVCVWVHFKRMESDTLVQELFF